MIQNSPYISSYIAATKYLFKHPSTIRRLCRDGTFKTARKIGVAKNCHWQISRAEVLSWIGSKPEY